MVLSKTVRTWLLRCVAICIYAMFPGAAGLAAPIDTARFIILGVYDPTGTDLNDTLVGHDWSAHDRVTVTCYYPNTVGTSICAGGGDFDKGDNCHGNITNYGTIIKDTGNNCWYRKNFGLNGVVDARQCGVVGDGKPSSSSHVDDADRLMKCLTQASDNGIPVVNTGGGAILDNLANIDVPQEIELTCGGNSLMDAPNDDYRLLKPSTGKLQLNNAIVIDPTNNGPFSIVLDHSSSSLSGCNVEAGAGSTGANVFSPSIWYPSCDPGMTTSCDDGVGTYFVRSAIDEQSAFKTGGPAYASTGITISGGHVTVRNVTVIGFGTCYSLTAGARPIIDHLIGDCDTGISIVNSNDPQIDSFNIHPMLTGGPTSFEQHEIASFGTSGSNYTVLVKVATTANAYRFADGDTVWIALGDPGTAGSGKESARGRWIVSNHGADTTTGCFTGDTCEPFTLSASKSTATTISGHINNLLTNGVPPTAITGIASSDLTFVAPGQIVTDTLHCVPTSPETDVVAVWPARGIVYLSAPATCSSGVGTESFTFTDHGYTAPADIGCTTAAMPDPNKGCAVIDSAFRFGDGFYADNVGGISAVNCMVFEHQISYHLHTGANGSRWSNCATGDNITLAQRNIEDLSNSIIGILIDGAHNPYNPNDATLDDACDNSWANSILGQHRPVVLVVQSNCPAANKLVNSNISVDNSQESGIAVEVDGGDVQLASAYESGNAALFKAEKNLYGGTDPTVASLEISNNSLLGATLYVENTAAGATTVGCGNVFGVPTPYLCAPSSFTQIPGGRLTLTACALGKCYPVMKNDVTMATNVYYVPYIGQQVPIYNTATGALGLIDIGSGGLTLNLDGSSSNKQLAGHLYDIFAEVRSGAPELCVGPAWTSGTARSVDLTTIDGIPVNVAPIASCQYGVNLNRNCRIYECTYLGTMYMTADGQTAQQFGPVSAPGGGGPCLCLYNAYNRVNVTSQSLDTQAAYPYGTSAWRQMGNIANPLKNYITVVDGLGQMQIFGKLGDAIYKTSGAATGQIGIDFNATSGTPSQIAQGSSTPATYESVLSHVPSMGLWTVNAMENAFGGTPMFGGTGLQALSIQVED